jgi:rubrerythrin
MKRNVDKIAVFLSAFPKKVAEEGIAIWKQDFPEERDMPTPESNEKLIEHLKSRGWYEVEEKPSDKEFYCIGNRFFVQSQEAHKREAEEQLEREKERRKTQVTRRKQRAMVGGVKKTNMKCPHCGNIMYKEPVCPSCKEGKEGYKIRLMCEDNPDHEVLL